MLDILVRIMRSGLDGADLVFNFLGYPALTRQSRTSRDRPLESENSAHD